MWYLEARAVSPDRSSSDDLLVVATDLGLTAKVAADGILVWVTSLKNAVPVFGARVTLWSENNQKVAESSSDDDGLVFFAGPFDDRDEVVVITAEKDGDLSYLEREDHRLSRADFDVRGRPYLERGYDAFLYSDRGVYRPGDTVHLAAIVRNAALEAPGEFPVEVEVLRPDRKRCRLLKGMLAASGSLALDVALPAAARTGRYAANLRLPGKGGQVLGSMSFFVEDFMPQRLRAAVHLVPGRPEEGLADSSDRGDAPRRLRSGEPVEVDVSAEYLAGLPAAGAWIPAPSISGCAAISRGILRRTSRHAFFAWRCGLTARPQISRRWS